LPVPGYPVLIDRSGSAFRAYGMYTRTAPEVRDDPWSSVMSGLSSEQSNRTDLLEIREGIALIGPDGLIEKLQPIDSENYLIDVLKAAVGVAH
jgi:hypothetical protein